MRLVEHQHPSYLQCQCVPYCRLVALPSMAQDTGRQTDPEKGNTTQDVPGIMTIVCQGFVDSPTWNLDDHPELPQSARNQPPSSRPPKGGSNFGDSSGPIFSMYSKITKEEDDQLAERWQKDADGILIFVSPCVNNIHTTTHEHKLGSF